MKGGSDTGEEAAAWELGRGTEHAARRLPDLIVVDELADVAAAVEQGNQGNGQDDGELDNLFSGDGNTLLSTASRSRH